MSYGENHGIDAEYSDDDRYSNFTEIFVELASSSEIIHNFYDLLPEIKSFFTCKKP